MVLTPELVEGSSARLVRTQIAGPTVRAPDSGSLEWVSEFAHLTRSLTLPASGCTLTTPDLRFSCTAICLAHLTLFSFGGVSSLNLRSLRDSQGEYRCLLHFSGLSVMGHANFRIKKSSETYAYTQQQVLPAHSKAPSMVWGLLKINLKAMRQSEPRRSQFDGYKLQALLCKCVIISWFSSTSFISSLLEG